VSTGDHQGFGRFGLNQTQGPSTTQIIAFAMIFSGRDDRVAKSSPTSRIEGEQNQGQRQRARVPAPHEPMILHDTAAPMFPRTVVGCVKWVVNLKCGGRVGDLPRWPEFL